MIGYPFKPKRITGERARQLAEKYLPKDGSKPNRLKRLLVRMPDRFTVFFRLKKH